MTCNRRRRPAIVLSSGGLDSTTCLALARATGFAPLYSMTFDYGQRHRHELEAAERVARQFGASQHRVVKIDLRQFGGSALTAADIDVPKDRDEAAMAGDVPITYVPARNTIFLSYALGWAEVLDCRDVFIGVNAVDYSGYPDCRPEFIDAFERLANLATRMTAGKPNDEGGRRGRTKDERGRMNDEGGRMKDDASVKDEGGRRETAPPPSFLLHPSSFSLHAPLIRLTKAQIIRRGIDLGVDYALTHSCYDPDDAGRACGRCDSCLLRKKGFAEAGVPDPTRYAG
ncbi:MAG TPA: 7-cyano-7-deazaguanine synthase [Tepidisphaeraceae bacterium]|nr:7-cyano-7-deazaguanine synthase [Tepidisphaeraceae bacterium]